MKLETTLLAVKNIEVSKRFYKELFGQEVVLDLGKNVSFSGGFAIQEDYAWLIGIDPDSIVEKSNNMELYFETEDFERFMDFLEKYPDVQYVHPPKKYEWQQRVVRIYDPDHHIIEIGESMKTIANRYLAQGYTLEQVAEIIDHPLEFVKACCSD